MTRRDRIAALTYASVLCILLTSCETRDTDGDLAHDQPGAAASPSAASTERSGADAPPMPASDAFVEVAGALGIDFVHNTGAFGQKWLPETMGSGCAWLDADGDGDQDLLLLSGKDFDGHPSARRQTPALYRNEGGTAFTDVTVALGLDQPTYAIGATCGDYDADGDTDVYVTAVGPNRLYRNDGARFVDVAAATGVDDNGFGSSAAWLDFDRDGDLDLFALNYVPWTPETDIFCSLDGKTKSYCTPQAYEGAPPRLFRNDGDAFTDVSVEAGVYDPTSKGLGIACFDYDDDGWEDVFVANDTQPDFLFRNLGDGTFRDEGVMAGVAYDETGRARGGMGVDVADFDHTGRPSFAVGNFSNEMLGLYHNEGNGLFIDVASPTAVGHESLLTLAFGVFFFDFDLDGRVDLFAANGHVEDEIQRVQSRVAYAQPPHLFQNLGEDGFRDVAPAVPALAEPIVARGCAYGDYDGDGDLDVAVVTSGGPVRLYRNDGADGARSVRITLEGGAGSNREGFGARVRAHVGERIQTVWFGSGRSYASQSEPVITFGLGSASAIDELEVRWPSGKVGTLRDVAAGSRITMHERDAS